MKRGEFEHAVRAAAAVPGVEEVLVIGSQALPSRHGHAPTPPAPKSAPGAFRFRRPGTVRQGPVKLRV